VTPEKEGFNLWIGGSKIVDSAGLPRLMFHGTGKDFSVFEDRATFFSPDPGVASRYAEGSVHAKGENVPNVVPVFLSIHYPFQMSWQPPRTKLWWERKRTALISKGFDGVMMPDGVVIAFHSDQIRHAIGNAGGYDLKPSTEPAIPKRSARTDQGMSLGV